MPGSKEILVPYLSADMGCPMRKQVSEQSSNLSICSCVPVDTSHSLTVLSLNADAKCLPSGEKATAGTEWSSSE